MKKIYLFLSGCLLLSFAVNANNSKHTSNNQAPFVFVENGIEYAVFNNGEFDFNIIQRPSSSININTHNINLSVNTGRNYEPYIQRNRYGAIVQIERTPILYNRYGKVNRIGSINIHYNYQGWVSNIGNLNIYYTNYGTIHSRRGYINYNNRNYRPHYKFYKRPVSRRVIVHSRPYRQNNIVKKRHYNSNPRKNNYKYSNRNNSAKKNQQKQNNKPKFKKQENKPKQTYRKNSNSYRRTSKSSDSKYVNTSTNRAKENKKR